MNGIASLNSRFCCHDRRLDHTRLRLRNTSAQSVIISSDDTSVVTLVTSVMNGRNRMLTNAIGIAVAYPPPELLARGRDGIEVTGRVPDVAPWLNAAALVVVPLRLGGGMRVKVVEALAYGKAVVASPRALEGLNVTDGVEVAVADSDDQFVSRILSLLESPDARGALARKAREWAVANLGAERWVAEYEALYDQLRPAARRS